MFLLKWIDDLLSEKAHLQSDITLINELKTKIEEIELEKAELRHKLDMHNLAMFDCPTVINSKLFDIFSIERRLDTDGNECTIVVINISCDPLKVELKDEYFFISRDAHKNLIKNYLEDKNFSNKCRSCFMWSKCCNLSKRRYSKHATERV